MKRDLDLLRNMMLRIEELDSSKHKITSASFEDLCDNASAISLHIELLNDIGYIEIAHEVYIGSFKDFIIGRLTFDGYDYLDAVRNQSIWDKTKEKLQAIGGSATLDIVKSLAVSVLKSQLGI